LSPGFSVVVADGTCTPVGRLLLAISRCVDTERLVPLR
jgi:hypothetical protein